MRKNNKIRNYAALILLTVIGLAGAFEKVGTTSFQFLKMMADARATAMAEAYTAVADGSDAVFWNPGALILAPRYDANFSYMDYFLDTKHYSLSASYRWGSIGTIGVQAMLVDYGEIRVTTREALVFIGDEFNPGLTGEKIYPNAMALGISFARSLTNKFSFGLTAKLVREDLVRKAVNMVAMDAGLLYRTGFRSLQISAVIRHFGRDVKYLNRGYPLPQTLNIGVSGYLIGHGNSLLQQSETHTLLLAADIVQPRDYDQQYNVGLEYGYRDYIFLRGGYKFNYDEESFTAGFGLHYSGYRIDYSYSDFGEFLDAVHRFTIGLSFK